MLDTQMLIGANFVAGTDLTLFQYTKVETGSVMRNHQGSHLLRHEGVPVLVAHDPRRALGPALEARRCHRP